jgi:K+/H+ antiporter YhaU regulatory subunit KhtT
MNVFEVEVPDSLAGQTLAESAIRKATGCSVIALENGDHLLANPGPHTRLERGAKMILIGNAESEDQFLARYAGR